jgi:hypothetical protein
MTTFRGDVSYPGVDQVTDCQYTCGWSTSPGRVALTIAPQDVSRIQGTGDLVFNDGINQPVPIADCQVVDLTAPAGVTGPLTLTLLDGRWRWDFGDVSGRWNIPFDRSQTVPPLEKPLDPTANQPVPPTTTPAEDQIREYTKKTAPELAKLLLKAMGVKSYDLGGLDPKATPSVNWVAVNPASALQQLATDLGCVVAFNPSTLAVKIAKQGEGGPLPGGQTVVESPELRARPRPSKIVCYGAPDRVQMRIPLLAAGLDFDGAVRPLDKLSYRPVDGDWRKVFPPHFAGLPPLGFLPGTRTTLDAVALARHSVYRYYLPCPFDHPDDVALPGPLKPRRNPVWEMLRERIDPRPWEQEAPPLPYGLTRGTPYGVRQRLKTIILDIEWAMPRLLPVKNQATTDDLGRYAIAPAACYGRHTPPERCKVGVDVTQVYDQTDANTEVKTPFSIVDLGNDDQAIVFHRYVYAWKSDQRIYPAEIVIECACEIRYKSFQTYRTPFELKLNNVPSGTGAATIIREDVRFQRTVVYKDDGSIQGIGDNKTLTKKRADYYLKGESRKYELTAAGDATYPGLLGIYPDGAIMQVTWSTSPPTTRASMNTEHALYLPSYLDRLKEDAADLESTRRTREQLDAAMPPIPSLNLPNWAIV